MAFHDTDSYQLGRVAFCEGKPCSAALDPALRGLLEGRPHPERLSLLRSWMNGWADASQSKEAKK